MRRVKMIIYFLMFLLGTTGCAAAAIEESAIQEAEVSLPAETAVLSNPEPTAIAPEPTNTPLPPVAPVAEGDPCSIAGQQQQIDAAFATYQAARAVDRDAVSELGDWVDAIAAEIAVDCSPFPIETTDRAELADLLDKLMAGGYVVYVRHTNTDRSRGDEDVSFGMCDKQRVLSDQGRDEALFIRNAYQQLDLPVSLLISTQYCRTLETAVLAFGVPRVILRTDLYATLTNWLATEPEAGTNIFIVAHIGTIRDLVGLDDTFEEGDSLIYQPTGDGGFEFVGRIGLYDWPVLAELNEDR